MRTSQPTSSNNSGAHGLGAGLGAATAQRLPVPPRERKPTLAALAVLLILGGALVSAYLVIASGQRVSAIKIVKPVAAGAAIPRDALEEQQVGDTGIEYLSWNQVNKVVGRSASVGLAPDSLLTNNMILAKEKERITQGKVIVGLSLRVSQLPGDGLAEGEKVAIYAVGGRAESGVKPGTLLSADAIVTFYSGPTSTKVSTSAGTRVSVAVPPEQAQAILQAASAESVAVARIPDGTTIPQPTVKPGG